MTNTATRPPALPVHPPASRPFFSFHVLLGALLATWIFFFCRPSVADPDLWWHLENARYLLMHHQFPRVDMYSYTLRGTPWINHEWLTEIPFYLVWKHAGLLGLYVLYSLLVEAVLLGMMYLAYKVSGNVKSAFVASVVGVMLAVVNFGPRSILFGWGYLIILLLILLRFRREGQGPLWLIPPLFCLWINSHGSWLMGMVVFGIIVACGLVNGTWGKIEAVRWEPGQLRKILMVAGASVAALFVNPYGYRLVLYPLHFASRQKLVIEHIEEWASLNFHELIGKVIVLLLAAVLVAMLAHPRRWRLEEVALVLFGIYGAFTYVRLLFLLAIVITPVLARRLDFLPPYQPEIDKPMLNAAIVALLVTIMVARVPSPAVLENDLALKMPRGGLQYLQQTGKRAQVLANYGWGGYMMVNSPSIPTFIDSRTDIFVFSGIMQDYLDLMGIKDSLRILDKHRIRYVLFPASDPLSYLLVNTPEWKVAYHDGVSMVFERTPAP